MSSLYLYLRKRIPEHWVRSLRGWPLVTAIVRHLQPEDEQICTLEEPLRGYRMALPQAWVYSMVWGEYEPDTCAIILKYVKPGMRVLDIGAHIGYHTLLLKKQVGANGEVICFEPAPENRILLHKNLQLNNLAQSIRIEPMALANQVSLMVLHLGDTTSQASLQPTGNTKNLVVPVCDLDCYCALLDWPTIHFIKMDIEGAESLAICGMAEVISRFHPMFLIEAHGEVAREGLATLQAQDYHLERLDAQGNLVFSELSQPIGHEHWLARHDTLSPRAL